jgi:uncharacterized membrane protein YhaH (DUF805 family)
MLAFYFSPMGRMTRKDFWLKYVIPIVVIGIVVSIADQALFPEMLLTSDTGPIAAIVNLVVLWPTIALTTKRFHDRNMSGWWQLLFNVALGVGGVVIAMAMRAGGGPENLPPDAAPTILTGLAIILVAAGTELVILGFLPGTKGRNDYGDDPLNPAKDVAEVFS